VAGSPSKAPAAATTRGPIQRGIAREVRRLAATWIGRLRGASARERDVGQAFDVHDVERRERAWDRAGCAID